MKRLPFLFVAVLGVALGDITQALAGPETTPTVTGEWQGFYTQGVGIVQQFTLAITTQVDRRFQGTLEIGDLEYALDGTVSDSGNVNIVGRGEAGRLVAGGSLHDFGGGAAVLDGGFRFLFADDSDDTGLVLILRNFTAVPGSPSPNVTGDYAGSSRSAISGKTSDMFARFTQGSAAGNTGFCGQVNIFDRNYTGCGTINGRGDFVVIAMGVDGPLCLQGRYDASGQVPRMGGIYIAKIIGMDFSEEDRGDFVLQRTAQPDIP